MFNIHSFVHSFITSHGCRQAAVRPRARYDPSEDAAAAPAAAPQRRTPTKPPHPSRMTHRAMAQSRAPMLPAEGNGQFAADSNVDQEMLVSIRDFAAPCSVHPVAPCRKCSCKAACLVRCRVAFSQITRRERQCAAPHYEFL